jgi:hypothetical protein
MTTSLNYLSAQERAADLRRTAEAERLRRTVAGERPASGGRSAARAAVALWLRITRIRSGAPGAPERTRLHA